MPKSKTHHAKLFDRIAFGYKWFFNYQLKTYRRILNNSIEHFYLAPDAKILDVGCGTGAFAKAFHERNYDVIGVDIAQKMINIANRKGIKAFSADIFNLPFNDNEFDLIIAANVIHGFNQTDRLLIYKELKRVSKNKILFHDYNSKRKVLTNFIEWIEQGDYFNFIKEFPREFIEKIGPLEIIATKGQSSWYFYSDIKEK